MATILWFTWCPRYPKLGKPMDNFKISGVPYLVLMKILTFCFLVAGEPRKRAWATRDSLPNIDPNRP